MRIRLLRKSFAERNSVVLGIIGSAVIVLGLLASLTFQNLPFFNSGTGYSALFSESGGLESGDDVVMSGLVIGSVGSVSLDHGKVRVDFTVTDSNARLGNRTTASVTTETVLGKRGLKLTPAGTGRLADGATIPLSRTEPPYDLTDALSGLTTTTAAIDTNMLARALRTITGTFKNTPAAVQATIRNVSKISATLASRDAEISDLLAASSNVTGILAQRNREITTLLGDGSKLFAVINARRAAVTTLLVQTVQLAQQLRGLVSDNTSTLGPALRSLAHVTDLLNANKQNIDVILDKAGPFAASLGESVSSGPFFQAYVQNLTRPVDLTGLDTSSLNKLPGMPGGPGVPVPTTVPTKVPTGVPTKLPVPNPTRIKVPHHSGSRR